MKHEQNQFVRLVGLATFLEQQENLDDSLGEFAAQAAGMLESGNCSIMLFGNHPESGDIRLRVFARFGELPPNALNEAAKVNEGIAGKVAATGEAVLVRDIRKSPYLPLARTPDNPQKCFISVPVLINGKVIGVLNLSNPRDGRIFDVADLNLATFTALLVGKSVQVTQLQNLLRSRFAQLALAQQAREIMGGSPAPITHEPAKVAKLAAKAFYQEMTRAGLGTDHIINAATEIISLLGENLRKHKKRIKGGVEEAEVSASS